MSNGRSAVGIAHRVGAIALVGVVSALISTVPAAATTNDTVTFGIQYPGRGITYSGGDHANNVNVDVGDTSIVFTDSNAVNLSTNSPCVLTNSTTVTCPKYANDGSSDTDKVYTISVLGNAGNDTLTSSGYGMVHNSTFRPIQVTLSGWGDNDTITALGGYSSLVGGPGADTLTSGPGKSMGDSQFKDKIYAANDGSDVIYADAAHGSGDADTITCDASDTLTKDAIDTSTGCS